jgi:hypothetical protein
MPVLSWSRGLSDSRWRTRYRDWDVKPKVLSEQALIGQRGVNLIERIVLAMGSRWVPSPVLDVGIDGVIELADPTSHAALGIMLHVQSRATERPWTDESSSGFDYLCEPRDLAYWLQGNASVLLIVSRPSLGEAYWVSIKDYFREPEKRVSRRIRFDKKLDRFDSSSLGRLLELAAPADSGVYLAPAPVRERLISNLVPVRSYAQSVFVADTEHRTRGALWDALKREGYTGGGEWFPKEGRIHSFVDLREPPWPRVCDRGTVDEFSAAEWADSSDDDVVRDFVRLLNSALRERLYPTVRVWRDEDLFAFTAGPGMRERHIARVGSRGPGRLVFSAYTSKRTSRVVAYRHLAFSARFRRHDRQWYLEINPTYLFTSDGREISKRNGEYVGSMKRLERNEAVLGNLRVCADILTREAGLFSGEYPHLSLGGLIEVDLDAGLPDRAWQSREAVAAPIVGVEPESDPELWR